MSISSQELRTPRTFDEVTAEWLTQVLASSFPGVKVVTAKVDPPMGHKPNKARVHLTYDSAGTRAGLPQSLVVKGSFPGYESRGAINDFANVAEAVSYRDIMSKLTINLPKIYYLGIDHIEHGPMVLLMEDLADRKASYFVNVLDTLTYAQAAAFLDAHARFHAESWNSPEFEPGGAWGPETTAGQNWIGIHPRYFDTLPHAPDWENIYTKSPRGTAIPRSLRDAKRMAAGWARLRTILSAQARVIVHGDEHLGNIFIQPDGKVGFVDMFARPEPWPLAVSYFLAVNLDIEDRRNWERPLLTYYLSRLSFYGAAAPGFEEAWYAYRCATIFPLLIWFNNSSKWQPESTNTANTVRAAAAVLDHDAYRLIGV